MSPKDAKVSQTGFRYSEAHPAPPITSVLNSPFWISAAYESLRDRLRKPVPELGVRSGGDFVTLDTQRERATVSETKVTGSDDEGVCFSYPPCMLLLSCTCSAMVRKTVNTALCIVHALIANSALPFISPTVMPQNAPGHTEVVTGVGMVHMLPLHPLCTVPDALTTLKYKITFLEVSPQVHHLSASCKRNCASFDWEILFRFINNRCF